MTENIGGEDMRDGCSVPGEERTRKKGRGRERTYSAK